MMKQMLFSVLFGVLSLSLGVRSAWAFEQISEFKSEITIERDTSLTIKEKLQYETDLDKHGIYRYIPYRYSRNGLNYTARVTIKSVTDDNGHPTPFVTSYEDGNVILKIGDPDKTFTGIQPYVITYQVKNALQEYETHDELYWDITGEGWQFEIDKTIATINSPFAKIQETQCFSGVFGGNDRLCQVGPITGQTVQVRYDEPVTYGDNVTVAVKLDPVNQLRFPTPTEKFIQRLKDNATLLPLLLPPLILGWLWWKRGRDRLFVSPNVFAHDEAQPQRMSPLFWHRSAPFVYEPIKELTPGEAGALADEKVDNQDVVAEIIDLARKKYLKIERTEKKKFLGSETDYVFTRLKEADDHLPEHQAYLLEKLFAVSKTVKLSELKGTFYTTIDKVKDLIFRSLTTKGLFASHPGQTRGWAMGLTIALLIFAFIWLFNLLDRGQSLGIVLMVISVPLSLIFAHSMPAKTAKGSNLALQARGLKETIGHGKWREKIKEKHLFIEEVLPFAIALGVVDRLARDMEELNLKPPQYFAGSGTSMRGWAFHSLVNDFSHQAASNLTYNPNSSSTSGGSGFSGGSSGGGGGGGGGGSW